MANRLICAIPAKICFATQADLNLHGLKILLDCANGAAYRVGPELFGGLGAEVVALNTESDGINNNVHAGSEYARSKPEALAALLARTSSQTLRSLWTAMLIA